MNYTNIQKAFDLVNTELFTIDASMSYYGVLGLIDSLAQAVIDTETDEFVWDIGEFQINSLDQVIIGAFWFLSEHHKGQDSREYQVLSTLGEIFSPGMSCEERNETYSALQELVEQ